MAVGMSMSYQKQRQRQSQSLELIEMEIEKTRRSSAMNGQNIEPGDLAKVAVETKPSNEKLDDLMRIVIRAACLITSLLAVSLMVSAKESGSISVYGFNLPVSSDWSFSHSFKYLVIVTALATVYSALHLFIIAASKLFRKRPFLPSRNQAWLIFAADQIFAYAMMSAGSAASGVTNLNRTGIQHTPLPNFCKPLHGFCDRVAASIAFTFMAFFLLAFSALLHVLMLSNLLLFQ